MCKWLNGMHTIIYSTLLLIHKINIIGQPKMLLNMFEYNTNKSQRLTKTPQGMKYKSLNEKINSTTLYKGIFLYNKIPESIKTLNMKKFKGAIKNYIYKNMPLDRINTYKDYEQWLEVREEY